MANDKTLLLGAVAGAYLLSQRGESDPGAPEEHTLEIIGTDSTYVNYEFSVTGEIVDAQNIESNDTVGVSSASGVIQAEGKRDVFVFTGEIDSINIDGTAQADLDGEVLIEGGRQVERYTQQQFNTKTIETTIYQSQKLTDNVGRVPERMDAKALAHALDQAGWNYDISFNYPPQTPPNESPRCKHVEDENGDTDYQESAAYFWWSHKRVQPGAVETGKDANVLLLNVKGGGCGSVGGKAGTANAADITEEFQLQRASPNSDNDHQAIHAFLHEFGHEMGASHSPNNGDASRVWGEGFHDLWNPNGPNINGDLAFYRTPNNGGGGFENACGQQVEPQQQGTERILINEFSDCAAQNFRVK